MRAASTRRCWRRSRRVRPSALSSTCAARRRSSRPSPTASWNSDTPRTGSGPSASGRLEVEMDALMLDGNAVAGLLQEVFAVEMTTALETCDGCGATAPVGAVHVYRGAG